MDYVLKLSNVYRLHCKQSIKDFIDPICCSFFTWFGHDFPAGQFVSVRRFLNAAMT